MRAIISTTYEDNYFFSLPIVVWCWNKLGVKVECFAPIRIPFHDDEKELRKMRSLDYLQTRQDFRVHYYVSPKHKEATYAQCSRLYAACLDLPEDEILVTGDVDMAIFQVPPYISGFTIFGEDLVPEKQYPMCYISAKVKDWRNAFNINKKYYQECLDELLGEIDCENMRGNYWGKDQETAYNKINLTQEINTIPRARPGTQFASRRYDRDDAYILDRLNPDTIDYHMNRPGYQENNFEIIMKILKYHYPSDNFDWLKEYREQYIKLL